MNIKHTSKKDVNKSKDPSVMNNSSTSSGKMKELKSKSPDIPVDESEFSFPILKTVDKANLHTYSAVLARSKDDGITMEDLDRLQPELECMLSAVAVRLRTLEAEVQAFSSSEEKKTSLLTLNHKKRKMSSEVRNTKSMKDLSKVHRKAAKGYMEGSSDNDSDGEMMFENTMLPETNKVIVPKNDTPNKFWAFVEPYCSEVTPETIKVLEELVATCENDAAGVKIPPLGKHYTTRWADEDMIEEKNASNLDRNKRKSTDSPDAKHLLKKASTICGRERAPGPLVQRLVSALMEENVTTPLQESFLNNKMEEGEGLYLSKLPTYHTTACFEKRIRRELEVVGLLDNNSDETDEILEEIKKCDEELKIVAAQNKEHLKRLLVLAKQELARQEVRNKIKVIDQEILEIYRKTAATKLKKKQLQKKAKEQAWKALKDREALLKTLENL